MTAPNPQPPRAVLGTVDTAAMDERTLEALRGSIAKWEAIVAGTGVDAGWVNCPLCRVFLGNDCRNCPVAVAAGDLFCEGTPYIAWVESPHTDLTASGDHVARNDEASRLAQAELDFLKSLLPAQAIEAEGPKPGTGFGAP